MKLLSREEYKASTIFGVTEAFGLEEVFDYIELGQKELGSDFSWSYEDYLNLYLRTQSPLGKALS